MLLIIIRIVSSPHSFFVFLVIYLVGGILFMRIARGAQGAEMIPNREFWLELPVLVKVRDFVVLVVHCITYRANFLRLSSVHQFVFWIKVQAIVVHLRLCLFVIKYWHVCKSYYIAWLIYVCEPLCISVCARSICVLIGGLICRCVYLKCIYGCQCEMYLILCMASACPYNVWVVFSMWGVWICMWGYFITCMYVY